MLSTIKKTFYFFDQHTRKQLLLLFGLMLLCSVLETGGIGLVVPFIAVVADPEVVDTNKWLFMIKQSLGIENPREFLFYMSFGLLGFYILKNFFIGIMKYLQLRFVYTKRSSLGRKLLSLYTHCPYTFHLEHNTAELFRDIGQEAAQTYAFVQSLLVFFTEMFVLMGLAILLLIVDPIVFIVCGLMLGIVSWIFYKIVHNYSRHWGEVLQSSQKDVVQSILEGFGAIKEAKIAGKENFFPDRYYLNMMKNAKAQWMHGSLSAMPALVLELFAVGSIVLIIIIMQVQTNSFVGLLPKATLFAVAAIRVMPGFSRIVSCLQNFRFYSPAIEHVYSALTVLAEKASSDSNIRQVVEPPLHFCDEIRVENVDYIYPKTDEKAVNTVSLRIPAGDAVAFVGPTGSGKTTMANIILGLLEPISGKIYVDDQDVFENIGVWQRNIGYVPQSIYLLDASVRNNVAFGLEETEIDDNRVWEALEKAQINGFIKGTPDGLNTRIGENGVRMSGGERQRIGIARALYHRPEVLVLDEATSALDNETERELNRSLEGLSGEKTMLIIAHRLSTIKNCDRIYFMENGSVVASGTYDEVYKNNTNFRKMAESGDIK